MKFPRRGFLAALGVVVAALAAGCGDTAMLGVVDPNAATPPRAADGGWTLLSINGRPLPYVVKDDATGTLNLSGGHLTIADVYFSQLLNFQEARPGSLASASESSTQGQVTATGNRLRFRTSAGEWEGTLITTAVLEYTIQGNNGPLVFRFRRN